MQQERAHLEHQLPNLEAGTREIIENELDDINDQLRTIRSMRENRGPIPPLLMLPNESFNSGPDSPQYAPGSPTGSVRSLHLNDSNISDVSHPGIIDVDLTPPGSQNTTPQPVPTQTPSAPTRSRRSRRGGTKKRKGKKRKTMKKKSAKKGKKTKKR